MPGIYSVLSLLNILNLKIPSHNTYFYILFYGKGLPEIFAVHESPQMVLLHGKTQFPM